jgi:hypothetical protein
MIPPKACYYRELIRRFDMHQVPFTLQPPLILPAVWEQGKFTGRIEELAQSLLHLLLSWVRDLLAFGNELCGNNSGTIFSPFMLLNRLVAVSIHIESGL